MYKFKGGQFKPLILCLHFVGTVVRSKKLVRTPEIINGSACQVGPGGGDEGRSGAGQEYIADSTRVSDSQPPRTLAYLRLRVHLASAKRD